MGVNQKFVEFLLKQDVLRFGEFTLKSGRISPYFFNAGNLDTGEALAEIGDAYAQMIIENKVDFDVIYGPAYKGIPLGATTANALARRGVNKRFVYDRKEAKEHGDVKDKLFVGNFKDGDRLLIIDDVITAGTTVRETIEKTKLSGKNLSIVGVCILMDRQEVGQTAQSAVQEIEASGIRVFPVLRAKELFEFLKEKPLAGKIPVTNDIYSKFVQYQ